MDEIIELSEFDQKQAVQHFVSKSGNVITAFKIADNLYEVGCEEGEEGSHFVPNLTLKQAKQRIRDLSGKTVKRSKNFECAGTIEQLKIRFGLNSGSWQEVVEYVEEEIMKKYHYQVTVVTEQIGGVFKFSVKH